VRLRGQNTGFDARSVFIAGLNVPSASYPDAESQNRLYLRLARELSAAPGVADASLAQSIPLSGPFSRAPYAVYEGDVAELAARPLGLTQSVTPGYFAAMRIPIVAGRDFTERDTADAPLTVIVSQTTARKLFPDGRALGRRLIMGSSGGGESMEIVGIVGDVRSQTLASVSEVEFYRTVMQRPRTFMQMVVRTSGDAVAFESTARRLLKSIDPALPLTGINTLESLVDNSVAQQRLLFTLLVTFAVLAVVLSAVGIYGVVAAYVTQRTAEFGVRIALGARHTEVLRLVFAQTLRPVFVGIAIGLAAAIASARLLQSLLFEVSALDPRLLVVSAVGLALIACGSCAVPALRATRVDPVRALRNE
jgi:predicted permease